MNRWKGVVEFVTVVEAGNFSKAADLLGITVSQVSKRVSELESRLGTRLLFRTTRSVTASPAGEIYYESCKKILGEFDNAEDQIKATQDELHGKIKIAFVGGSRPTIQVHLISDFLKQNPHLSAEVVFLDNMPNMVEEQIDLAVVVGEVSDCGFPNLRLSWAEYGLCASTEYLEDNEAPSHPCELEDHACITSDSDHWLLVNEGSDKQKGESIEVDVHGQWSSLNVRSCIDASIYGLGITQVPNFSIPGAVAEGKLVHILPEWVIRKPIFGVVQEREYMPNKIIMLLKFFRDMFGVGADLKALQELNGQNSNENGLLKILEDIDDAVTEELAEK